MHLHRAAGDGENLADLVVDVAERDELEDGGLARSETNALGVPVDRLPLL